MSIHAEVDPKADSERTRMADRAALAALAAVAFERQERGVSLSDRLIAARDGFVEMLAELVAELQAEPSDAVAMRLSESVDVFGDTAGGLVQALERLDEGSLSEFFTAATKLSEVFAEEVERLRRDQVERDKDATGLLETA